MNQISRNRFLFFSLSFLIMIHPRIALSYSGSFFSEMDSETKNYAMKAAIDVCRDLFFYLITGAAAYCLIKKFYSETDQSCLYKPVIVEDVTLKDYVGVPQDIDIIIEQIKNSEKYVGIDLPSGIMLKGPPGVGKTYLARAIAGELKIPYFPLAAPDLFNKWVGEGPRKIGVLFNAAREAAKNYAQKNKLRRGAAIICIDEIEELRSRNDDHNGSGVISKLLTEMSGFDRYNVDIMVIATVNNEQRLDPALLRSGRFGDKILTIGYPDQSQRKQILDQLFEKTWQGRLKSAGVSSHQLSLITQDMSQADLKTMMNNVARCAAFTNNQSSIQAVDKALFVKELWKNYCEKQKKEKLPHTPQQQVHKAHSFVVGVGYNLPDKNTTFASPQQVFNYYKIKG